MEQVNSISFYSEDISYELPHEFATTTWLTNSILEESKLVGDLTYIFCSDEYLYKLNIEHLNHDTLTDIITFDYCEDNHISGDVFISIDRVRENAKEYNTNFEEELHRVMIHGALHLIGYNDKSESDKLQMRAKEDFYLSLLSA